MIEDDWEKYLPSPPAGLNWRLSYWSDSSDSIIIELRKNRINLVRQTICTTFYGSAGIHEAGLMLIERWRNYDRIQ